MSRKYCIDANIFITAWNITYPPEVFPTLWDQLRRARESIVIIKPIFDEIDPVAPSDKNLTRVDLENKYPLNFWMKDSKFIVKEISYEIDTEAINLEREYETDEYSKGAGAIDIKLIAFAKHEKHTVVTLEKYQVQNPTIKSNYKIPLICTEQNVQYIDFIKMLQELGIRI